MVERIKVLATSFEMIECIRNGGLNKYLMRDLFSYHFYLFIGYNSLFYISYFFMTVLFQIFFLMGLSKPITINWVRVVFINSSFYLNVYIS